MKNSLIDQANQFLNVEKKRNIELKDRLMVVSQPQFVEGEVRNKLFLVKPGEGIIVIAPTEYLKAGVSVKPKKTDSKAYWQQWWETFF